MSVCYFYKTLLISGSILSFVPLNNNVIEPSFSYVTRSVIPNNSILTMYDFTLDMNNYENQKFLDYSFRFRKLNTFFNVYYKVSLIDSTGNSIILNEGAHTGTDSNPSNVQIPIHLELDKLKEVSTFEFTFSRYANYMNPINFSFKLSSPKQVVINSREALIYYKVVLKNNEITNYREKIVINVEREKIYDYYIKIPLEYDTFLFYTESQTISLSSYLLMRDPYRYFNKAFTIVNKYKDYKATKIYHNLNESNEYYFKPSDLFYVDKETLMMSKGKGDFTNCIEGYDIYLPQKKYSYYKTIDLAYCFEDFGSTKIDVIVPFKRSFMEKYLKDTSIVHRSNHDTNFVSSMGTVRL